MNKMLYKGKWVDGDTFHPPYAPAGMTLAQCRKIDNIMHKQDNESIAMAKVAMEILSDDEEEKHGT